MNGLDGIFIEDSDTMGALEQPDKKAMEFFWDDKPLLPLSTMAQSYCPDKIYSFVFFFSSLEVIILIKWIVGDNNNNLFVHNWVYFIR